MCENATRRRRAYLDLICRNVRLGAEGENWPLSFIISHLRRALMGFSSLASPAHARRQARTHARARVPHASSHRCTHASAPSAPLKKGNLRGICRKCCPFFPFLPLSSRFFPACTLAAAIKLGEPRKDWLALRNRATALCEQGLTFGACQEL